MDKLMYHFNVSGKIELEENDQGKHANIKEKIDGATYIMSQELNNSGNFATLFEETDSEKPLDRVSYDMDQNGHVRALNLYTNAEVLDGNMDDFNARVKKAQDVVNSWTGVKISIDSNARLFKNLEDMHGVLKNENGDPLINADGEPLFDNAKDRMAWFDAHPELTEIDEQAEADFASAIDSIPAQEDALNK